MPLPMVHIATAIKVYTNVGKEPNPMLILGSISPDSIHMRENASREDKWGTHFREKSQDDMVSNTKPFLDSRILTCKDLDNTEFIIGYGIHILTDFHWSNTVHKRFMENLPEGLPKGEISRIYYIDTDQIDINLYRCLEWRPKVWEQLKNVKAEGLEGLLTDCEIERWKIRTLEWYDVIEHDPKTTPKYITEQEVLSFVDDAANYILQLFTDWNIAI